MKWLTLVAALVAVPAAAQDRDLCTDRPGLGTPACTVQPGKVQVETGLADWTRDRDDGARTDTWLFGDTLVRIGVAEPLELQLGWTPYGHERVRHATGVQRTGRVGDALVGLKYNFASPDGSGFSLAVQPQVTLPIGREPIGAGDWGASVVVPVSYDLSDTVQLQATPVAAAAVDEDGHGRHAAYGATLGLGLSLSDAITAAVEAQAIRDEDPGGTTTQALLGLSVGWQIGDELQLDAGSNIALDHDSDDLDVYVGISQRF